MEEKEFYKIKEMLGYLASRGLKRSESWARKKRMKRIGPRSVKIGGTVLYPAKDLKLWFESSMH